MLPTGSRRQISVAIGAAAAAFIALRLVAPLGVYEAQTVDFRFRWRGVRPPDPHVVIVAIDEPTLSHFKGEAGRVDEWPRARHGQLLDRLTAAGAAAVGWDVTFSDRSRLPGDDQALADAICRSRHVVLPMYQSVASGGDQVALVTAEDSASQTWLSSHGLELESTIDRPLQASGWVLPTPILRDAAADIAYIDTLPDADGVYRHIQLLRGDTLGRWRQHLAAGLFSHYVQSSQASEGDRRTLESIRSHPDSAPFIDYAGPPNTIPRLSYLDVLQGRVPTEQLKGKIILVGRTGVSEDVRANPFSATANGIEITANALSSLLQNHLLRRAPFFWEIAACLILSFAGSLLVGRLPTWPAFAAVVGTAAVYVGLAQGLFTGPGLVLPMLGPLLAEGLSAGLALHYRIQDEEKERRRIQAHWQSFVGPEVLKELLNNPDLDAGHGVRAEVTVLFSDIRGYSTLSEHMDPQEVIRHLNEHFQEMVQIIFKYGGTVLGVTGDGLLVVFGWPGAYTDHADRALLATREIAERLTVVNQEWKVAGRPALESGFGVHSGAVVAGRVGGDQGSQLTVIGDTVNVAARVQDLNKTLHSQILITGSTFDLLETSVETGKMASIPVKGRREPVAVYEILHAGLPQREV